MGASFGNDTVTGGAGDDDLGGGTGRDVIDAGDGNDSVGGGEGDDAVDGGAGADFLAGGGRNDTIDGGSGNDTINGGDGSDLIRGGIGADVFVWNSGDRGAVDIVEDFELGTDQILLVGVTNAPGTGLAGKLEALDITDVTVEGQDAARLSYNGQEIYLLDVAASDLTLSDFEFI
ncbi:hypothetical protein LVO79_19165 (plasmid) [Roseivivax marinus]|nr:hypothetical protein LVO79_19165 [Roseivivax marinus]